MNNLENAADSFRVEMKRYMETGQAQEMKDIFSRQKPKQKNNKFMKRASIISNNTIPESDSESLYGKCDQH